MRRLNVKLTVWLVSIAAVSVVGVHFLHGYQLERNAEFLKRQAEAALDKDDAKNAIKQYNQYLKYRDDPEGYSALAELVVTAAKDADATKPDKIRAYNILEEAIRRHPDLNDVRRKLIDYTMLMRRYDEALVHIQYLIDAGEKDAALDVKAARCYLAIGEENKAIKKLYEVVGFDEETGTFKPEPGPGSHEIEAFQVLAQVLARKSDMVKRADEIMAKLVEWNADSAKAHLSRASYLAVAASQSKDPTEGLKETRAELDKAYAIAPDDVDVAIAIAGFRIADGEFAQAQELLDKALKTAPQRADIYVRLAQLANGQKNAKQAAEYLQQGVKRATDIQGLVPMLAEYQLQLNDLAGVKASSKLMQERGTFPIELIRYYDARVKLAEGDFWGASHDLEAVRPAIVRTGNAAYLTQLDLLLARCYETLGQSDRQLEAYQRILAGTPTSLPARLGEAAALQALGRFDESGTALGMLLVATEHFPFIRAQALQMLITDQMRRPLEGRDWKDVDKVAEMLYEDKGRSDLDKQLLKADLLLMKDQPDDAQKLLVAASKESPKDTRVWLGLMKLLQQKNQAANVGRLLDRAEKEAGDQAAFRAERIRIVARDNGENAAAELAKLEQGLDRFTDGERASLMMQLGGAYLQLDKYDDVKRCWKYVTDHDPKNAVIRQMRFELAIDQKDNATVREIVKEVHDSPQWGPQSPFYEYLAATAMLWPIHVRVAQPKAEPLSDAEKQSVAEARKLIDEAIATRGSWSPLWRVRGEIDQLDGNPAAAIGAYQHALESSRSGQSVIARRLVQLLYRMNRFSEADEALKKFVGEVQSADPLAKISQRLKMERGDTQEALAMAAKDLEANPKDPATLIWYGQLLEQVSRSDEAEDVYRRATVANPELAQAWTMLVRCLVINKKMPEAAKAVRDASEPLAKNELAMGRLYELISDPAQAESHYKAAAAEHPDDVNAARQVVEYYFRSARDATSAPTDESATPSANEVRDKYLSRIKLAEPYLDAIVKHASKSNTPADAALLAWAHRSQAEIVAAPGDYEHVGQATKLIEQNAKNGKLAPEDIRAAFNLLAKRPDPKSRAEAAHLLEQLQQQRPLTADEQFALGQLYETSGQWTQGKELLVRALVSQGNDPAALVQFANVLMKHDEKEEAARWLDKLDDVISKSNLRVAERYKAIAGELRARLLVKMGQPQQAVTVLEGVIPRPLAPSQLSRLEDVSKILEQLELYDASEKLLNEYTSQDPRGTIAMAAFRGRRGDVDKAFGLLEEARKNQSVTEILPVALEVLRMHPDQATPARFKLLESWAKTALESESNSPQIKLLLAETYDVEGRHDDVIKVYRDLLASKTMLPTQAAIMKNNLAFMLAITKDPNNAAEALKLTDDAIRIVGPVADLLDTRALALLAQGKVQQAVADLRSASADDPSPTKYFHLAQAEKQANNIEAARDALAQAQKLGVDVNRFSPLEKKGYQQLVDELK